MLDATRDAAPSAASGAALRPLDALNVLDARRVAAPTALRLLDAVREADDAMPTPTPSSARAADANGLKPSMCYPLNGSRSIHFILRHYP